MNLDQALQTFIAESRELLEEMETSLLAIGEMEDRAETINAIFRAAHTIKGSSGLFGLDNVVAFTHLAESVLDEVRDGKLEIDEPLVALLLSSGDHIGTLIDAVDRKDTSNEAALQAQGEPLMARLSVYLGKEHLPALAAPVAVAAVDVPGATGDHWHISLRFGESVLRNGMDPLSFIRYLGTLGDVMGIVTVPDALPAADQMDPESCYLGFEIALRSTADKAAIESVFDFVLDDCTLRILPPNSRITEYIDVIKAMPSESSRLGEMLVACGTLTAHELAAALESQTAASPMPPIGKLLVEQGTVQPSVVAAALEKQKSVKEHKTQESQLIRVDAQKLDHLITLVGELITATASATLLARRTHDAELQESNATLAGLVQDVRDSALQLRMVKIGATFNRFQRVVHDVSRELGKDIALVVSGEDTELDKTVVEKIGDPLMHLIRNSMDHGIEPAEVRMSRGKPARGTVKLNAFHDSGSIVIEIHDDGGGLPRDKILAKAIERGLVEPGRALSDTEIYGLIFEPGFSTAEQVTNLSGRGVGMDVVKRNIAALRGSVAVDSQPGQGTSVTVRLPLTLAIINGFQVEVAQSVFVLPLDMIEECVEYRPDADRDYVDLRGQVLPLIRLRELFDVTGQRTGGRENVVVVKHANQRVGLIVDTLLGEFQTVIKPLNKMFSQVQGISGSSIRGNGDVALILDVPAVMQRASQTSNAQRAVQEVQVSI
jgi:two-component system chemotaxis sensor kinase CheA